MSDEAIDPRSSRLVYTLRGTDVFSQASETVLASITDLHGLTIRSACCIGFPCLLACAACKGEQRH
jgi:hypothetical protein